MGILNTVAGTLGTVGSGAESQSEQSSWNKNQSTNSGASASITNGTEATQWARENAEMAWNNALTAYNMSSQYNASEAQKTRDWQEYMANTAYQRAMADMKKAGLNPILAYSMGGAAVPSGATASTGSPQSYMASTTPNSASSSWNRGESSGSGGSYGWSTSTSGLAEGLKQMGQLIADAVNAVNSAPGIKEFGEDVGQIINQAGETAQKVGEFIEDNGKTLFDTAWKTYKNTKSYVSKLK